MSEPPQPVDRRASDSKSAGDVEKESISPSITAARNESATPGETLKETTRDVDEALKALAAYQGQAVQIDEETSKRLLRKIDWNLMPVCSSKIESVVIKILTSMLSFFAWCMGSITLTRQL